MILASESVANDEEWSVVVDKLMEKHNASLATFTTTPCEVLEDIRIINPRYVAIVDKPENINRDYVIDLHLMCREVDNDIMGHHHRL